MRSASPIGGLPGGACLDRVARGVDTFFVSASGEEESVTGDLDDRALRFTTHRRVAGPDPLPRDEELDFRLGGPRVGLVREV